MIILAGPIGAGKSAQAQILVERYGYKWISTGELLRKSDDEQVKELLHSGQLVPDSIVKDLLAEEIAATKPGAGIIIDGFPRRISQAEWLDEHSVELGHKIDHVIHITLDEQEAIKRMLARGRHDDSETAIKKRNETYTEYVLPVVDYYREKGIVSDIDGLGTVEEVATRIKNALGK